MKGVIVEVDLYYKIRTLYNEGESIRSISRRLGISRQTVKKYCEGNTHPDVRKSYTREADIITDDVRSFIIVKVKHFFQHFGKDFFQQYGKQIFPLFGKHFFQILGKEFFLLLGKHFFHNSQSNISGCFSR